MTGRLARERLAQARPCTPQEMYLLAAWHMVCHPDGDLEARLTPANHPSNSILDRTSNKDGLRPVWVEVCITGGR